MSGSSHARLSPQGRSGQRWFAWAVLWLASAATLPQGSTGFFESRWVAAGAWALGVAGWLGRSTPRSSPAKPAQVGRVAAAVLLGWCLFQFLPLPKPAIGWVWRGNPELLDSVAAASPQFSIAVNRFVSLHALCLWSGLGVLAWAVHRQLRSRPAWSVVCWGAMGLGVFQSLAGVLFLKAMGGRLTGTFASPNAFGGLLAVTLPLTLGLIFRHAGRSRMRGRSGWSWWAHQLATDWSAWTAPALWAGFGIQWIGLLFSGSVGAMLATLATSLLLLVWRSREHPESRRRVLGTAAALVLLAVIFSIQGYRRSVLSRTFDDSGNVWKSQASRVEIWRAAVRLCRQFPWGTGPGGSATVLPMYQTDVFGRYRLDYAHNDTLQFWGDLGPVGFGALALLLGLTGWQGWRGCRAQPSEDSRKAWLRRGAWAAFLSALLHAQGEFNLSARPGIQVWFAVVCGMLWAAGESAGTGEPVYLPGVRPCHRWRIGPGLLVAAGAMVLSLAAAWAWRLNEGAQRGVGLVPDEPRWYLAAATPAERALDALGKANRLAPQAAPILRGEAEVRMALHQSSVAQAARQWLVQSGSTNPPPNVLDPMEPTHRQALELGGLALRIEESHMLRAAQSAAEFAVAAAPWDAAARLTLARVLFRRASIPATEADAGIRGLRELDIATRLYPRDGAVLAEACTILAIARRSADRQRMLDWGTTAMALNPALAVVVLQAWRAGSLPMGQVLQSAHLPASILWQLYVLLDRHQRSGEARQCLDLLAQALDEERSPLDSGLWTSAQRNRWSRQQAKSRMRWVRESLKHALLAGDWATVRSLAQARDQALDEELKVDLATDSAAGGAAAMKRLRLRAKATQGGLPPQWVVEWSVLELQAGQSAKPLQEPLLELFCMDFVGVSDFRRMYAFRGRITDAPMLGACLDAKEAELAGRPAEAAAMLDALLGIPPLPARRFQHRLWLWRARMLRLAGDGMEASTALEQAAALCPADPDVASASSPAEFPGTRPPPETVVADLDIRYQGGRLRLEAIEREPAANQGGAASMHLVWRFLGLLPPDLKLDVRLRDGQDRVLSRQTVELDGVLALQYNRGAPPLGSRWRWPIAFPPAAASAERLEVVLRSAAATLATDEGLSMLAMRLAGWPPPSEERQETVERTPEQD